MFLSLISVSKNTNKFFGINKRRFSSCGRLIEILWIIMLTNQDCLNIILFLNLLDIFHSSFFSYCNGIFDNVRLGLFDSSNHVSLILDSHESMNNSKATISSHSYSHVVFGDCIHGRRNNGYFQRYVSWKTWINIDLLSGIDLRVLWYQEDIVKGKP